MSGPPEPVVLAVDVGGTTIKGDAVDEAGVVVASGQVATPPRDDPDAVVAAVHRFSTDLAASAGRPVLAAGVVVPGSVDAAAGVARYSANLGWRDVPLRDLLGATLSVPVVLDHDVRAAAVAERAVGLAHDTDHCTVVVIGTGIAAVSYASGVACRGASGQAGELGHVPVRPGGELCACGQRGCLEAYASAGAIARRYAAAGGAPGTATAEIVGRVATDERAATIWSDAVAALGTALVIVTMLDDPELVVLGGGLAEAGEVLLQPVRESVAGGLTWRAAPRIEASPLGGRAGRRGAAVLGWQAVGVTEFSSWAPR